MRLKKYHEKKNKNMYLLLFTLLSILLVAGVLFYRSYALYEEVKDFDVIKGTVEDPGDIYFAYYVDNIITREIPKKGTGYTLDKEKSNCTNGITVDWNQDSWSSLLNYEKYSATNYTRTRCNLYFTKNNITAVEKITELVKSDTTNLTTDEVGNIRYIGKNPNNYVRVDGELWRIIGVMKDIDDGTGTKRDRVKLIRSEPIGNYSWYTSEKIINNGFGINEWSKSHLMKLLNEGYETESVDGSLYWNNTSGTCYIGDGNATRPCDFSNDGIKTTLKSLIDNVVWNTGSQGTNTSLLAKDFYTYERSSNNGKICSSSDSCNDTVTRTTLWTGKVGLMYPSDYGYATGGGSTTSRATCLNTDLSNWGSYSDCYNNNWIFLYLINSWQLTLTPKALSDAAFRVFVVNGTGAVRIAVASSANIVRPVVYLKNNVKISGGDGSSSNPFVLLGN